MRKGCAKYAGFIAFTYAFVFFGGIFFHYFQSGNLYTLKYSLSLPSVWMALTASLVIGWGLIKKYRWAWWLGLFGVLFQLYRAVPNAWQLILKQSDFPMGIIVVLVLFSTFLLLLLTSSVRKECLNNVRT
jgi:hypothetical protein